MADDLRHLSQFPSMWIKTMTKVTCNGYRQRVNSIDKRSVTQNIGVLVNANTNVGDIAYYGVLTEIIELNYPYGRSGILFRCDWVDPMRGVKQDELGFTLVNLMAILKTNEPFVLTSQALQVFYTIESKEKTWHVTTITKPRDLFEMEEDIIPEVLDHLQTNMLTSNDVNEINIVREDVAGVTIDEPFVDAVKSNNGDKEVDFDSSICSSLLSWLIQSSY